MMPARTMVLLLVAVGFSAVGQLCLKVGARRLAGLEPLEFFLAASRDVRILSGLVVWMAWMPCWLYALRIVPLSRAYGLTSLTYVLVPLASVWLLGEQVRRFQVAGMVLIVLGIACMLSGD